MIQLTQAQRRSISEGEPIDGFTIIDIRGVDLGKDKYNQNVYLAVIKRDSDEQLFGVPWSSIVESYIVGTRNEGETIVPLRATPKTIMAYEVVGQNSSAGPDLQL